MLENILQGNVLAIIILVLVVVCTALVVLMIVVLVNTNKEKMRLDSLLRGADGNNLESALNDKFDRLEILEEKDDQEQIDIRRIYKKFQGAYQKTGIIKYNAFMESGGKLSFALALLDEKNSGFLLNVMNSNDGSYCYLKEIERGSCEIALGKEEAEALEIAMSIEEKEGRKNVRY